MSSYKALPIVGCLSLSLLSVQNTPPIRVRVETTEAQNDVEEHRNEWNEYCSYSLCLHLHDYLIIITIIIWRVKVMTTFDCRVMDNVEARSLYWLFISVFVLFASIACDAMHVYKFCTIDNCILNARRHRASECWYFRSNSKKGKMKRFGFLSVCRHSPLTFLSSLYIYADRPIPTQPTCELSKKIEMTKTSFGLPDNDSFIIYALAAAVPMLMRTINFSAHISWRFVCENKKNVNFSEVSSNRFSLFFSSSFFCFSDTLWQRVFPASNNNRI